MPASLRSISKIFLTHTVILFKVCVKLMILAEVQILERIIDHQMTKTM